MVWGCGDEDEIIVGVILRIIISDEGEVEWEMWVECDELMERGRVGGGDMCGEREVLVLMCKEVFVEERMTVGGKVAWRSRMRSMELVVVLGV